MHSRNPSIVSLLPCYQSPRKLQSRGLLRRWAVFIFLSTNNVFQNWTIRYLNASNSTLWAVWAFDRFSIRHFAFLLLDSLVFEVLLRLFCHFLFLFALIFGSFSLRQRREGNNGFRIYFFGLLCNFSGDEGHLISHFDPIFAIELVID